MIGEREINPDFGKPTHSELVEAVKKWAAAVNGNAVREPMGEPSPPMTKGRPQVVAAEHKLLELARRL